jgi:hypothetical protein
MFFIKPANDRNSAVASFLFAVAEMIIADNDELRVSRGRELCKQTKL